jgi:hypothetical protein
LVVKPWRRLVAEALADAIAGSIMNWRFGGLPPTSQAINSLFSTWLNTSSYVRPVDDLNQMKLSSVMESVIFEQHDESMSHNGRIFNKSWIGLLDPSSTTTSDKVNLVYRRSFNTAIKDHRIVSVPSDTLCSDNSNDSNFHSFCSTLRNNIIVPGLGPRRLYLLRTTFENSETLELAEEPVVKSLNNQLSGVNLLTCIQDYGEYTFEDCIGISQSAADRMACRIVKRETIRSLKPINYKIKVMDIVKPGQELASNETEHLHANKIYKEACVAEIIEGKTIFNDHEMHTLEIVLVSVYKLKDGDKISNRHAVKAVVKIIPDDKMLRTEDGRLIDIIVSPKSIYGRRSMSMYYEMMASKAEEIGVTVNACTNTGTPSFKELAGKFGASENIKDVQNNNTINAYIGKVYWIRINKHSVEMRSEKDNDKKNLNQYGVLVDSTESNGQRFDLAKTLAFQSKGLEYNWKNIVKENAVGTTRLKRLVGSLLEYTLDA